MINHAFQRKMYPCRVQKDTKSFLLGSPSLHCPVVVLQEAPAHVFPEASSLGVCVQDKGVAFPDSRFSQCRQTPADQSPGDASLSVLPADREMAQNATSTFLAAEDCANDPISVAGDEAKASIASQVDRHPLPGVRFIQAQPLGFFSEGVGLAVVSHRHLADSIIHLSSSANIIVITSARAGCFREHGAIFLRASGPLRS
jgi:hypothetical protein